MVVILRDTIGLESFYRLLANRNREVRCVIYTGVTLFALLLPLNYTPLSQNRVMFSYILLARK